MTVSRLSKHISSSNPAIRQLYGHRSCPEEPGDPTVTGGSTCLKWHHPHLIIIISLLPLEGFTSIHLLLLLRLEEASKKQLKALHPSGFVVGSNGNTLPPPSTTCHHRWREIRYGARFTTKQQPAGLILVRSDPLATFATDMGPIGCHLRTGHNPLPSYVLKKERKKKLCMFICCAVSQKTTWGGRCKNYHWP